MPQNRRPPSKILVAIILLAILAAAYLTAGIWAIAAAITAAGTDGLTQGMRPYAIAGGVAIIAVGVALALLIRPLVAGRAGARVAATAAAAVSCVPFVVATLLVGGDLIWIAVLLAGVVIAVAAIVLLWSGPSATAHFTPGIRRRGQ